MSDDEFPLPEDPFWRFVLFLGLLAFGVWWLANLYDFAEHCDGVVIRGYLDQPKCVAAGGKR